MKTTVGLFGTCSNSKWRESFIKEYKQRKIDFFNPDLGDDWTPDAAENENKHLMEDDIILFPVLAESLGFGSLGEIGFSIMNVMKNVMSGSNQYLIVLIDNECDMKDASEEDLKLSRNTRKIIKSKVEDVDHPNVFLVNSLDKMKELSFRLVALVEQHNKLKKDFS